MSSRWLFALVGALAMLAGAGLWLANGTRPRSVPPTVTPEALFAASFHDVAGKARSLGDFRGKVLVLNFWATWCAPCRAEMPALSRLQTEWAGRNVQFVGLADDDPARVRNFAGELSIAYPLLVGGPEVDDFSQRLGNRDRVLPYTVIVDAQGRILAQKVGAYSQDELGAQLTRVTRDGTSN
jgi:thiol-disulfide isomerase/thioredoxin